MYINKKMMEITSPDILDHELIYNMFIREQKFKLKKIKKQRKFKK